MNEIYSINVDHSGKYWHSRLFRSTRNYPATKYLHNLIRFYSVRGWTSAQAVRDVKALKGMLGDFGYSEDLNLKAGFLLPLDGFKGESSVQLVWSPIYLRNQFELSLPIRIHLIAASKSKLSSDTNRAKSMLAPAWLKHFYPSRHEQALLPIASLSFHSMPSLIQLSLFPPPTYRPHLLPEMILIRSFSCHNRCVTLNLFRS